MLASEYLWELILGSFPFRWIVGRKVTAGSTGAVVKHRNQLLGFTIQYGKPAGAGVVYGYHHPLRGPVYYPLLDPFYVEIPQLLGPERKKTYLVCSTLGDPGQASDELLESIDARYQEVGPDGEILDEKQRKTSTLHPARVPNLADRYGFSCFKDILLLLDDYDHLPFVRRHLEFSGMEHGLFCFRGAWKNEPYELPPGCQGSPILDEDAQLVSLLAGGDRNSRMYYGLNLWKFLSDAQFAGSGI